MGRPLRLDWPPDARSTRTWFNLIRDGSPSATVATLHVYNAGDQFQSHPRWVALCAFELICRHPRGASVSISSYMGRPLRPDIRSLALPSAVRFNLIPDGSPSATVAILHCSLLTINVSISSEM